MSTLYNTPQALTCVDCKTKSVQVSKNKKFNVNLCVPCFVGRMLQESTS
jgi:hypothetical protein